MYVNLFNCMSPEEANYKTMIIFFLLADSVLYHTFCDVFMRALAQFRASSFGFFLNVIFSHLVSIIIILVSDYLFLLLCVCDCICNQFLANEGSSTLSVSYICTANIGKCRALFVVIVNVFEQ